MNFISHKERKRRDFQESKVANLFWLSVQKWMSFKKELPGDDLQLLQNYFAKFISNFISQGYFNTEFLSEAWWRCVGTRYKFMTTTTSLKNTVVAVNSFCRLIV